jgi:hypothetical protein
MAPVAATVSLHIEGVSDGAREREASSSNNVEEEQDMLTFI